jgi:hypothetical protein
MAQRIVDAARKLVQTAGHPGYRARFLRLESEKAADLPGPRADEARADDNVNLRTKELNER